MKTVLGRIVARGNNIVGLFIPIKSEFEMYGIFQVEEIMGEITIRYIGKPDMKEEKFTGLDLDGLLYSRPHSTATTEEVAEFFKQKNINNEKT